MNGWFTYSYKSPICFKENDLKSSTSRAFFVNPAEKILPGVYILVIIWGDRPLARGKHFTSTYYSPEIEHGI